MAWQMPASLEVEQPSLPVVQGPYGPVVEAALGAEVMAEADETTMRGRRERKKVVVESMMMVGLKGGV